MIQKRATSVAFFFLAIFGLAHINRGLAQEAVYRCGNAYTNDVAQVKREKCKLLEGMATVTIPQNRGSNVTTTPKPLAVKRSAEQQTRDTDAKAIIESELKKTQAQLADLRKQHAALSASQDVDRKLALKQQIDRGEADIASLRRELKR
jgi:D-serine deaminase-like pyridoxal phosphate-dependent protein